MNRGGGSVLSSWHVELEARGPPPRGCWRGVGPVSLGGGSVLGSWLGVLEFVGYPPWGPRQLHGRVTDGLSSDLGTPPRCPWQGDGRGGDWIVGCGEGSILGSLSRASCRGDWRVGRGEVSVEGSPVKYLGQGGGLTSHGESSILNSLPRDPWREEWLVSRGEVSIEGSSPSGLGREDELANHAQGSVLEGSVSASALIGLELSGSPPKGPSPGDGAVEHGEGFIPGSPPVVSRRGDGRGGVGLVSHGEGSVLISPPRNPWRGEGLGGDGLKVGVFLPRGPRRWNRRVRDAEGSVSASALIGLELSGSPP